MGELTLKQVIELVSSFGFSGLVFIIWYFGQQAHAKTLAAYREDMQKQARMYEAGLADVTRMYENNVILVQQVIKLSEDFKDLIMLNTQAMQRVNDAINSNLYCPAVRLEKHAKGVQL